MLKKYLAPLTVANFSQNLNNLINSIVNSNNNITAASPIKIWLGFSGGLDSTVLLELTREFILSFSTKNIYKLIAVHINHSINKDADLWQEHCANICNKLNIKFKSIRIIPNLNLIKKHGSLEAALRISRIQIWKKLAGENDIILLAHHLNDQIETFFFRLSRGSGLTGLSSMHSVTVVDNLKIIRPLLYNSKQQIELFANKKLLNYINDDSNKDEKFARNFIRHSILPKLEIRWPNCINKIGTAIYHLQEIDNFINNQANLALNNCYSYENYFNLDPVDYNFFGRKVLAITELLKYDNLLQTIILRNFIVKQGFYPPSKEQLTRIYNEIIYAKIDRQPELKIHQYIIYRYKNKLYIYPECYIKHYKVSFGNVLGDLTTCYGNSLKIIKFKECNPNIVKYKKIKKIFQKFGIPPWKRYDYPLVFLKQQLIAILGLWCRGI